MTNFKIRLHPYFVVYVIFVCVSFSTFARNAYYDELFTAYFPEEINFTEENKDGINVIKYNDGIGSIYILRFPVAIELCNAIDVITNLSPTVNTANFHHVENSAGQKCYVINLSSTISSGTILEGKAYVYSNDIASIVFIQQDNSLDEDWWKYNIEWNDEWFKTSMLSDRINKFLTFINVNMGGNDSFSMTSNLNKIIITFKIDKNKYLEANSEKILKKLISCYSLFKELAKEKFYFEMKFIDEESENIKTCVFSYEDYAEWFLNLGELEFDAIGG